MSQRFQIDARNDPQSACLSYLCCRFCQRLEQRAMTTLRGALQGVFFLPCKVACLHGVVTLFSFRTLQIEFPFFAAFLVSCLILYTGSYDVLAHMHSTLMPKRRSLPPILSNSHIVTQATRNYSLANSTFYTCWSAGGLGFRFSSRSGLHCLLAVGSRACAPRSAGGGRSPRRHPALNTLCHRHGALHAGILKSSRGGIGSGIFVRWCDRWAKYFHDVQ